jgi:hypothetical protein
MRSTLRVAPIATLVGVPFIVPAQEHYAGEHVGSCVFSEAAAAPSVIASDGAGE